MELSKRLQAAANLLTKGLSVADIGCDHGFLSIYLVKSGRAPYCIAMDVNRGPLERAREHIDSEGLSTYIETRLSDGAAELRFNPSRKGQRLEVEAALLAGMGGRLMIRIIEGSLDKFLAMKEFVLQPQSEISLVRQFIRQIGCRIVAEDMVLEGGKFYPMMKVVKQENQRQQCHQEKPQRQELFDCFGEHLLKDGHPVLKQFLTKEEGLYGSILQELQQQTSEGSIRRRKEIEEMLSKIRQGLEWFRDEV
ncbi:MAG: tRNA (adenine(22)-N(1))-methyltransferase [Lachnospiraceae bacterium]